MQYHCYDYYEEACFEESEYGEGNYGCCLICDEADEGCLCFNCKCRKCFWYNPFERRCDLPKYRKRWDDENPKWYISNYHYLTERAVLSDLRSYSSKSKTIYMR